MNKIKEIVRSEVELATGYYQHLIAKYNRWIYDNLEFGLHGSLPLTQSSIPLKEYEYTIKDILILIKHLEREGTGESMELTPLLGRYIRLINAIQGQNPLGGHSLDLSDRFIKSTLSIIGITSHMICIVLASHYFLGFLNASDVRRLLYALGECAVYGNLLHLYEKVHMMDKLIKNSI